MESTQAKRTPKQEAFAQLFVETGNASEAYRQVYNAENMKPESIHRKAKEVLDNVKVAARVAELQQEHADRHEITVDSLIAELEEARILARDSGKAAPMVTATMGKAKLLGLEKQVVDHTSSDGSMSPRGRTLADFYADTEPDNPGDT